MEPHYNYFCIYDLLCPVLLSGSTISWGEGTRSPQDSCWNDTLDIIWENKMMLSTVSLSDQGLVIYKNKHFIKFV